MKIISARHLHEWDKATIEAQNISSDMLMERASVAFVRAVLKTHAAEHHFVIVCGIGNNGGDGFCIARLLHQKGYKITVVVCGDITTGSNDAQLNYQRLQKWSIPIIPVLHGQRIPLFKNVILIDALFGTGLNRAINGWMADVIQDINGMEVVCISVDMPSGLFADIPSDGAIIKAHQTITFQTPKLAFFFEENAAYIGDWQIVDIGLSPHWLENHHSAYTFIQLEDIQQVYTNRPIFSHKGTYGHACIIAGSVGMPGAAALCASACLQTGAGLVTQCTDNPAFEQPEIMYATRTQLRSLLSERHYQAIAIGPGLGTDQAAIEALQTVLTSCHQPMVIDADALNIVSAQPDLQQHIPANSILTPHPKEWMRFAGAHTNWMQLMQQLRETAARLQCIIVYKKAFTIVVTPDGHCTFNGSGNPGMATAGSGDVLTGVLAGLIAQGYTPEIAARTGVFLHGLAGDLAMQHIFGQNLVAGDIIDHIQAAYGFLSAI